MLTPKPTQLSGASFLAAHRTALLADLPRVGKTGTAILAADYVLARTILVVTTASGRGVWKAAFGNWSGYPRKVQVLDGTAARDDADVIVVSWGALTQAKVRSQLLKRAWDGLVLDEAHAAKSFATKRTQAVYGVPDSDGLDARLALTSCSGRVWALTGTPLPNCPLDVYPMLRALAPERLGLGFGPTDVTALDDFTKRYCRMRPMRVGHGFYAKRIDVFVEGLNLDELRARLAGFFLQRTQQDVGILEPVYETMPLDVSLATMGPHVRWPPDHTRILEAAERGDTQSLEMHLGPLRRLTGEIKAYAVAAAMREELDAGLDKVVLAYWHRDVGDILARDLAQFGVARVDGSTAGKDRTAAEQRFLKDRKCRVFLGQVQAAGEAIDLSSAAHLVFVETSFTPKDMLQMSLRVTNHTQQQRPLVRVATLEGSVDDALQQILMRKWTAIKGVLRR